jgi:hypothetical protein
MPLDQSANCQLTTLDLISCIADTPQRPLDFVLITHFKRAPSVEALRVGAISARNLYPTTGSHIRQRKWIRHAPPDDGISVLPDFTLNTLEIIEQFVDSTFDPHREMPVRQLLIKGGSPSELTLVTRFHHAAADGLSAILWLNHQFRVAQGKEVYQRVIEPLAELTLRGHPSPKKKSRFAFDRPSDRLWFHGTRPSRTRRWRTIHFKAACLQEFCRRVGGFTYNDLLATCLLEVFIRWNQQNGAGRSQNIGLWLPINIRQKPTAGFGNGTSRIRLYARYGDNTSFIEKCRCIRQQISWSTTHGEWAVPTNALLRRLPFWVVKPLLRCYLDRPGIDMGSGVFSHLERPRLGDNEIFENVDKIDCIGPLHKRHCVAVNGATYGGQTSLTFTYDPGLLSSGDISRLIEMYEDQVDLIGA